ncbi:Uncharacterised protein [uncultured archaeon]|nr:Uncharacterised protein [uncultured archaeon]
MDFSKPSRFWELDFIRGLAVVMMVLYHFLYDLNYFGGYTLNVHSGLWLYFAEATAAIFIVLVGVSLTLSASRSQMRGASEKLYLRFFKRGLRLFSLGLVVTLATYLLIGRGSILFGVLHFIGVSIVLAYPFLRLRTFNLFAGSIFILIGIYLQGLTFNFPWLLWLGLVPYNFYTLDYFPIFPWFGLVLIGIFLGNRFYQDGKRGFRLPDLSGSFIVDLLGTLGRNSLVIYLVHQPVIVATCFSLVSYPPCIQAELRSNFLRKTYI